ncbi:MAG: glycosyltransferase [Lachnospiraceae bacterium]|nr:glycosyltransferase [Lachnospiraceae bacterium]
MDNIDDILVSVIIPIYNVEKYIEKCLDSVLGQTWQNLEIICVNDGTPDGSMEIVERKSKEDSRIVVVNQENGGLSRARNAGIAKATGKYIYFLDSDDYLQEYAIGVLVNYAEAQSADMVFFGAESVFETEEIKEKQSAYITYYNRKGNYSGVYSGEELFVRMLQKGDFKPSACLIFTRRELVARTGICFYSGILHEDNLYTLQLIQRSERAVVLDMPLYKRLIREESITSGAKSVRHAYGFFVTQREMLAFLGKHSYSLAFFTALKKYFDIMKRNAVNVLKDMELEEIYEEILKLDAEAVAYFMEYIYDLYIRLHSAEAYCVSKKRKVNKLFERCKKLARKLRNRFVRIRNKLFWMIPAPVRWYARTIRRLGFGYFLYRKHIKKNPDKLCVSVVMPVYNVERYLAQTLDSLLGQNLPNIEIICVDDGSTDASREILQKYEKKDARIRVLSQEKSGAGPARNLGMSVAKGEYLLFLDSDDIFDESLCNEAYYQCIRKKADVCLFGAKRINMQTFVEEPMGWVLRKSEIPARNLFSGRDIKDKVFQITTGCPWSKMFRREFVMQTGLQFQNLPNTNDAFFVRMAMILAERITTVDRCFVTYRYNEGNNTQSNKAKSPLSFYEAFKAMKLEMQKRNVYETFERSYCNMVLSESLFNLRTAGTEEAREKVRELLLTEALDFYGLDRHPESYFYDKKAYEEMRELQE